jgi:hypothetical protein
MKNINCVDCKHFSYGTKKDHAADWQGDTDHECIARPGVDNLSTFPFRGTDCSFYEKKKTFGDYFTPNVAILLAMLTLLVNALVVLTSHPSVACISFLIMFGLVRALDHGVTDDE